MSDRLTEPGGDRPAEASPALRSRLPHWRLARLQRDRGEDAERRRDDFATAGARLGVGAFLLGTFTGMLLVGMLKFGRVEPMGLVAIAGVCLWLYADVREKGWPGSRNPWVWISVSFPLGLALGIFATFGLKS